MRHCRIALEEPLVEKSIKRIQSIEISFHRKATAVFTVRLIFDKRSYVYQSFKQQMFVKAEVDLQKQTNGTWLITRAEILELDLRPVNWQDIIQANLSACGGLVKILTPQLLVRRLVRRSASEVGRSFYGGAADSI